MTNNNEQIDIQKLFKKGKVIGIGGFGKVWSVTHIQTQRMQAMKEMSKIKVVTKKSANSVLNERNLLVDLKNEFIINMHHAFQNDTNLYLTMDLVTGGDLRLHISRKRYFCEEEVRFMAACLISALEYLYEHDIIHRDIKPENILVDAKGQIRLTDMGIARHLTKDNASDTSGTPGQMSPEVMCCYNHDFRVDYQALGVICQEMILGKRPYNGANRKEIRADILSRQEQIRNIPKGFSARAVDFTNRCILRKPGQRLGKEGIHELKNHEWFQDFDWQALKENRMRSPIRPMTLDNIDYNISKTTFDYENQDKELCSEDKLLKLFQGYDFKTEQILTQVNTNTESTKITEGNMNTLLTLSEVSVRDNTRKREEQVLLNSSRKEPPYKVQQRKKDPNPNLKPLNMSNQHFEEDSGSVKGINFMTPPNNMKSPNKYKLEPIDMNVSNTYRPSRHKDKLVNNSIDASQFLDYNNKKTQRDKMMSLNFESSLMSHQENNSNNGGHSYRQHANNMSNHGNPGSSSKKEDKINFEFKESMIKSKDKLPKIKMNLKDKSNTNTSPKNKNTKNKYLMFLK